MGTGAEQWPVQLTQHSLAYDTLELVNELLWMTTGSFTMNGACMPAHCITACDMRSAMKQLCRVYEAAMAGRTKQ